ncbi:MAG TPA: hypothetical protein VER55_08610 [Ardenticatenaceae bacterium]|nr:hypothetical protein [Ardenticatenaceae bacterium]
MKSYGSQTIDVPRYMQLLRLAEERTGASAWEEAAALWTQVVEINPTQGTSWARLGQARHRARQYRQAIPALERALHLGPFPDLVEYDYNHRWAPAYDIARCYAQLGEKEQALAWLRRALELGYRHRATIHQDEALQLLHDDERFRELAGSVNVSTMPRDEGWRHDLALLAQEIKRLHYDPFRHVSEAEFDALVRLLHEDIPTLSDHQVIVGIMRMMRQLGDGHSVLALWERGDLFPDAPVDFYLFPEGVFVTAAAPEYHHIVGAEVLAIGDHSTELAIAALDPLIGRDNEMSARERMPFVLRKPSILHALGLIPDPHAIPLTVRNTDGTVRTVRIAAGRDQVPDPPPDNWQSVPKSGPGALPLYLKDAGCYWFEYLPDEKIVYFQYRSVRPDENEPFEQFCSRLFEFIENNEVEKLVIDIRRNGGGNTLMHFPLFGGLARSAKLRQGTRLFVVIGRQTFSAAMNAVTMLEGKSLEWGIPVIFVGEPTGASPNFIGETTFVTLPYSKLRASNSDLYWQTSWPMDTRVWLAPQLYAPPSFAAYRENRDPALEAILAYRDP